MVDLLTFITSPNVVSPALSLGLVLFLRNWISNRLKLSIKAEYDKELEIHKAKLKSDSDIAIEAVRMNLNGQLESHKARLKFDSDMTIEQFKANMQIAAFERNIQYSKVFDKTLEVISETSLRLHQYLEAVKHYTAPFNNNPGSDDMRGRRNEVRLALDEFMSFYRPRRLFLPKSTASQIDQFHQQTITMLQRFRIAVDEPLPGDQVQPTSTWFEVHKFVSEEIPRLLELLEDDFRKELGMLQGKSK